MKNSAFTRFKQRRALKTQLRPRTRWLQTFAAMLQHALVEPRQVEVTHQRIFLSKLPREFHGFRIAQLSDIHHSPFLSEQEIASAVSRANQLQADLVVLTGDYISHSRDYIPGCARALGGLQAPHGVFAIMGNHDHWTDGPAMESAFIAQGIRVLTNENVKVELGDAFIQLLGVDDLMVGRDDLPAAMLNTSNDQVRILLCHNPRIIREAARAQIDL
ncbi:MAG: metallophosphoesterase, partial [Acidobacteriota bacterium]